MGYGRFMVSAELLKDLLHLPDDTRMVSIGPSHWTGGPFEVIVAHDDIESGPTPIDIDPIFVRQPSVVMADWNPSGEGLALPAGKGGE